MTRTHSIQVHPSNAEQLAAWDGDEGTYWAAHAERFDRVVDGYDRPLFDAAAIEPTERVLDIGCGAGLTTRLAARRAIGGWAVGIDLSSRLLEEARRLAASEGVGNVTFEQADAQVHAFDTASFDLAFSRTGTMFFGEPTAAFTNIGRALRPSGRLVMLTWQPLANNEWLRELFSALTAGRSLPSPPPNAPGPFALSDPSRVRAILGDAGYTNVEMQPAESDVWFGDNPDDAVHFVLGLMGWMLHGSDETTHQRALANLHATTAAHHSPAGVTFQSAAWITTATRR